MKTHEALFNAERITTLNPIEKFQIINYLLRLYYNEIGASYWTTEQIVNFIYALSFPINRVDIRNLPHNDITPRIEGITQVYLPTTKSNSKFIKTLKKIRNYTFDDRDKVFRRIELTDRNSERDRPDYELLRSILL